MKKNLNLTLVQINIFWQDKAKNYQYIEDKIKNLQTDIVLLPEMFNVGFNIKPEGLAEDEQNHPTLDWMKKVSNRYNFTLAGSLIWKENENYYNRLIFMRPDGNFAYYDKRHTFTMAGEHKFFAKGDKNVIINYLGWRIKPLVCYDLRFPVWARNKENYDLLIYVANWPHSRIEQWKSLIIARAIENQSYVAAVNRVGEDGNGFYYSGLSMVVSPKGEILHQAPLHQEQIAQIEINLEQLHQMREKFPVLKDMDTFSIENEQIIEFWANE